MSDPKIWIAIIGAFVTALGWLVTNILERKRTDRKRTIEAKASYIQKQVEELYGPLFNLSMQIVIVNHVKHGLLQNIDKDSSDRDNGAIEELFANEYFLPLHEEVRIILKSKLHLVEGNKLPDTFYTYLRSSIQEKIQHELWAKHKLDTHMVEGISYPDAFTFEIQK